MSKRGGQSSPPKVITRSDQASLHRASWTGGKLIKGELMPSLSGEEGSARAMCGHRIHSLGPRLLRVPGSGSAPSPANPGLLFSHCFSERLGCCVLGTYWSPSWSETRASSSGMSDVGPVRHPTPLGGGGGGLRICLQKAVTDPSLREAQEEFGPTG